MLDDADNPPSGRAGTAAVVLNALVILFLCCIRVIGRSQAVGVNDSFWSGGLPDNPLGQILTIFLRAVCYDPRTFAVGFFSMAFVVFALAISKLVAIRVAVRPRKAVPLVNWQTTSSYLPGWPTAGSGLVFAGDAGPLAEGANKERPGWFRRIWTDPVWSKVLSSFIWTAARFYLFTLACLKSQLLSKTRSSTDRAAAKSLEDIWGCRPHPAENRR